jgi:sec-independent protein translocase protein TatB
MFDFGFSEIVLTSAIALVVLGPERLPKVARQVGNWMGRARVMARQLTEQLEREVDADELLKQRAKSAPPTQAAPTYPDPLPSDPLPPGHFPPDPSAPAPVAAPAAAEPPAAVTPAVVEPPRAPHPNSPLMMHAHEQPAPPTDQPAPATSHKPGDE